MKKLKNIWQIPWSIIYTWEQKTQASIINIIDYDENQLKQTQIKDISEYKNNFDYWVKWIDFIWLDQTKDLEQLWKIFDIDWLTLEDIANIQQRPKSEEMDNYIFLSLKMFNFNEIENTIKEEQISLIIWKKYLISFQENQENDDFQNIKDRILKWKWKIRKMKSDYLMYSILDAIVDQYFVVLEKIEEKIEELEEELIDNATQSTLPKIQNLKQKLIILRKSIRPVREVINSLQQSESDIISENLEKYLRDIYDHTIQIIDTIETSKDIISSSLDIYLGNINNKMNEVMKVLTIIGTIFIPLTFIVGVYGMNFKYMPELNMKLAYPILWIIMILIVWLMLRYFRRKKRI